MTGRITREFEETFGVIVKSIFLTVVMTSQAKIFRFHTLYICSLLHVIYTPIKLFKLIYIVYNYVDNIAQITKSKVYVQCQMKTCNQKTTYATPLNSPIIESQPSFRASFIVKIKLKIHSLNTS